MALSRRLSTGKPPLMGCTQEQPLPAHAAAERSASAAAMLRNRERSLCIRPSGPQITSSRECPGMKIEAPTEYRELDHTADVAIEVDGAVEEEVYARAALALGQMLAGGGPMTQQVERTLEPAGHDRVSQLIGLLRDVLAAFYDERLILCAIDVRLGPPFAATGWYTKWDPALHR